MTTREQFQQRMAAIGCASEGDDPETWECLGYGYVHVTVDRPGARITCLFSSSSKLVNILTALGGIGSTGHDDGSRAETGAHAQSADNAGEGQVSSPPSSQI